MKLNENTTRILNNFASICTQMKFEAGNVIMTRSEAGDIVAGATLDQEFPQNFAVYELPRFLNVLKSFKEPNLDFKEYFVTIGEGKRNVRYVYTDPTTITSVDYSKKPKLPKEIATFKITYEQLAQVLKTASILKLDTISFESKNGVVKIIAHNPDNDSTDTVEDEVGVSDIDFSVHYQANIISVLPYDYNVTVYESRVTKFSTDNLYYYILAKVVV
jgi:hypothetical protein